MNLKDRLIKKLVNVGKKHRLLVYPTLALIAIISAISHAIYWGKGNGKKLVASVMVVVMLITQSLFLTSSADEGDVGNGGEEEGIESQTAGDIVTVKYYMIDANGDAVNIEDADKTVEVSDADTITVEVPDDSKKAEWFFGDAAQADYFDFTACYTDAAMQNSITEGSQTVANPNNEDSTFNIYFKATRIAYPFEIADDDNTYYTDVIDVPVDNQIEGDICPEVTYTLGQASDYSIYKRGYNFNGVVYDGGQFDIADDIVISVDDFVDKLTFVPQWASMEFDVKFVAVDDGSVDWPSDIEFPEEVKLTGNVNVVTKNSILYSTDETVDLYSDSDIWAFNEAYILTGWYDKAHDKIYTDSSIDAISLAKDYGNIEDVVNVEGVTLYAIWTYREIVIDVNNSGTNKIPAILDDSALNVTVSGTYGDSVEFTINAEYRDGREDDTKGTRFTYEIGEISGVTGDAILAKYGLTGTQITDKNGIKSGYRVSGKLSDITDGQVIPLKITDSNSGTTSIHYITLVVERKQVSIDTTTIKGDHGSTEPPKKQYNGLYSIGVSDTAQVYANSSTISGKLPDDNVYISMSGEATLDDVNASDTLKSITLHNVKLAGSDADMYVLVDTSGSEIPYNGDLWIDSIATVDRCDVKIQVSRADGTDNPVYFGQTNPMYLLEIVDPVSLAGDSSTVGSDEYRYLNAANASEKMDFLSEVLGFTGWKTTPERHVFSPVGTYEIEPSFNKSISNYKIELIGDVATFDVIQEAAEKDVNYKYSTQKASNGFYPGLKITPFGGYTLIRELKEGDHEVDATTTSNDIANWFKSEIKIDDCVNQPIRFQMYKPIDPQDSSKGCSITTVELDTVSVDNSVPVYVSHQISESMKDLVNTDMNFGSYYHAQNGIETITLTFIYNSEYSTCKTLHYYFLPEGSTTKGGEITTNMTRVGNTNNYMASVTIGTANSGQLIVYAENSTGGVSVSKRVRIESADDFDIDNDDPSVDYYEWMVENNPLTADGIIVTDINGNPISDVNAWYNGLKFSAKVSDTQSGINRIEWKIVDANNSEVEADSENVLELSDISAVVKDYGKVMEYNFRNSITSENLYVGDYYISAVAYDNAGNKTELDKVGPFKVDCHPPVIKDITPNSNNEYISNLDFKFTVTEGENESGVDKVAFYELVDDEENEGIVLSPIDNANTYSVEISKNAKYRIVATDKAGNKRILNKEFNGISNERPKKPVITVIGKHGNDDWYKEDPVEIHISADTVTEDGVPVNTEYRIIYSDYKATGEIPKSKADDYIIPVTSDGIISVEAWSISEADLESGVSAAQIKVDTTAPELTIGESATDENGNIVVNFTVSDKTSGVANVFINGNAVEYTLEDGVAVGQFAVTESKEYVISAIDNAGNRSDDKGFEPLTLEASPIMNITPSSAYIEADVYEGTYLLDDCYIAYKQHDEKSYATALVSKDVTEYGVHMEGEFKKLTPGTVYDYKVYAITKTSKEVRVIEGSFKTADDKSIATIKGTAVYAPEIFADYDKYPIYVSLYEGNVFVAGDKLEDDSDKEYIFTNVADGTYRVVATDGLLNETKKVVVANGGITSPENYLSTNGLNFILDGMSTSVVIEDNSLNLAPDGLDAIFDSIGYYEGVVTKFDKGVLEEGGSIDISLHAKYIDESELSSEEIAEFKDNMSSDEHIKKYISIYVIKTVRDADGIILYDPELVTMLYDDIRVTFPLNELSGERVYVAMAHKEKAGNYTFKKWNDESKLSLGQNYVTIATNQFSTYALYTVDKPLTTHIVKWMANGKVIKSEVVPYGSSATPPSKKPTKAADSRYTYKFGGWDITDYSNITEDTIISAWFIKTRITKPDDPTTEKPTTEGDKPSTTEGDKPSTTEDDKPGTTEHKKPSTTEKPSPNKPGTTEKDPEKEPAKDVYLGSNESPKTGDEAPIVFMFVVMSASLAGVVSLKKKKDNE